MRSGWLLPWIFCVLSCNGTTGFELVQFYAAGRGFSGATKGQPYSFDTGAGVQVTLTRASLHVGALYLTQYVPQPGGDVQPCTLPQTFEGAFVGEVLGDADIDLLDPAVQPIPVIGEGSTIPASTGQVWLLHDSAITGSTENGDDPLPVLTLEGTFADSSGAHTFSAGITIDTTRIVATNPGLPGEIQICQERIVSGIAAQLTLARAGTLVLGLDAARIFNGVRFTDLPSAASLTGNASSACLQGTSTERCFTNDDTNPSSIAIFDNLQTTAPYQFEWHAPAP
jgi:hypothetical protein